ncbi:MAG: S8/S53 family peptidase [Anaerolineae bacterium]|nr:S8/S53 family peptidase [Anaerolineae bacterium]
MTDSPSHDDKSVSFFVPGELFLHVEHDRPLEPDALKRALLDLPLVARDELLANAVRRVEPDSVVSTTRQPQTENQGCNWILALLTRLLNRQANVTRQAADAPTYFSTVFLNIGREADRYVENPRLFLTEFVEPLYRSAKGDDGRSDILTVRAISPNWIASSSQGTFGSGGPGARPVPPADLEKDITAGKQPWAFNLGSKVISGKQPVQNRPVTIAVLDTAPSLPALRKAVATFPADINPLLHELVMAGGKLPPNDRLVISYDTSAHMALLNDHTTGIGLADHDYQMTDHGLFAAGIAATLAPNARIHLIQVLNDYGVGSFQTISGGLSRLLSGSFSDPLVVNLSLTLEIPLPKYVMDNPRHLVHRPEWEWLLEWLQRNSSLVNDAVNVIQDLCDELNRRGAIIVAAAGNEGANQKRPPVRWPAAFESVHGVAALSRSGDPALYSNLADDPTKRGLITFGGDMDMLTDEADPHTGMLGLYIGEFPGKGASKTGWGRWAGTSFATPIIAGSTARLISTGHSAQDAINAVYLAGDGAIRDTQEEIFDVPQG